MVSASCRRRISVSWRSSSSFTSSSRRQRSATATASLCAFSTPFNRSTSATIPTLPFFIPSTSLSSRDRSTAHCAFSACAARTFPAVALASALAFSSAFSCALAAFPSASTFACSAAVSFFK